MSEEKTHFADDETLKTLLRYEKALQDIVKHHKVLGVDMFGHKATAWIIAERALLDNNTNNSKDEG